MLSMRLIAYRNGATTSVPTTATYAPTINRIGNAPVIALTATATDKVRSDIKKSLGIIDAKEFKSSFNRPNLYYEVRQKGKDIDKQIIKYIKQNEGKSGIVYCISRKKVEELAAVLKANDIKAAPYHAGLDSATRSQTQDDFLMERIDVIVANHRLRHGNRQTRCAFRHALRHSGRVLRATIERQDAPDATGERDTA